MTEIIDQDFHSYNPLPENQAEIARRLEERKTVKKATKNGLRTIIAMMVFTALSIVLSLFVNPDTSSVIIEGAMLLAIFGTCYYYAEQHLQIALIVALAAYVLSWILSFIFVGEEALKGAVVKVGIIYYSILGIVAAFKLAKIDDQLRLLGARPE